MSVLPELAKRFHAALMDLVDDPAPLLEMIRPSQDPKFGDYQANFAMSLGKSLERSPRDVAAEIVARLDVSDLCDPPEIAGPGFINLRLRDRWIVDRLRHALRDPRLGVETVERPQTFVLDFSAPNIAKPMHVGHIRSTVIGNSLAHILRFAGHRVITDNHIGDWGTQFGMIIYGYCHFVDPEAYAARPVQELARLYRLVRKLVDYHASKAAIPTEEAKIQKMADELAALREAVSAGGKQPDKRLSKDIARQETRLSEARQELESRRKKLEEVDNDPALAALAAEHAEIGRAVLEETAKLHAGDDENIALWREFLPPCEEEMNRIYRRLNVTFDHVLGESFYHDRLAPLVDGLLHKGIARLSDGAVCIFFQGQDVPMLVRKKDGAFLYATTDLATIQYRVEQWSPDAILYVVDHRQSLHFQQLFAAASLVGWQDIELRHISFGTVLGDDRRPFKTRAGDTVGLESLLDEAVARALRVVTENDNTKPGGPDLSESERKNVAETVGTAALVYADLSQNRESDYVFSYDKMLAMNGNTATYMQYAYARVRSIFARGGVDVERLRQADPHIVLATPAERALALALLRFSEAIDNALKDYRPNCLTDYLYDLANRYSSFFEQCPVLKAETAELRSSRLLLCDLTARTIQKGLELLGIQTVERM